MPAFLLGLSILLVFLVEDFSVNLFTLMYIGIAMISTASSFIWEDRLTMNLRFMAMAGVKPYQYLLGTGGALLLVSFVILFLFSVVGGYFGGEMVTFLSLTMLGAAASILLGITVALTKPSLAWIGAVVPYVFGFAPMLAELNESMASAFYFTFTQQINIAVTGMAEGLDPTRSFQIVFANIGIILLAFVIMHKKNGLEG